MVNAPCSAPLGRKRRSESGCDARSLSTGRSIRAWRTLCSRQRARATRPTRGSRKWALRGAGAGCRPAGRRSDGPQEAPDGPRAALEVSRVKTSVCGLKLSANLVAMAEAFALPHRQGEAPCRAVGGTQSCSTKGASDRCFPSYSRPSRSGRPRLCLRF